MTPVSMMLGLLLVLGQLVVSTDTLETTSRCFGMQATIVGTEGDDDGENGPTLFGTDRADVIVGLRGDDTINGLDGNDLYCGGAGDDTLLNAAGDDHIAGGGGNDDFNESFSAGDDVLIGGRGTDIAEYERAATVDLGIGTATGPTIGRDTIVGIENLSAGSQAVVFIGDSGPNELRGNEGRDRIRGRGGDDVLVGDELVDTLNGGPGHDTCYGTPSVDIMISCEQIIG